MTQESISSSHASGDLATRFCHVRAQTETLSEKLSDEDCALQSMPDASPVKWHLAHTTWFFETFVLNEYVKDYKPLNAAFRYLYNSYYNAVGEQFPRARRGLISRPALNEVRSYRRHVGGALAAQLDAGRLPEAALALVELGIHHEQQHQELILTDVKHLLSLNPLAPAYCDSALKTNGIAAPLAWAELDGGLIRIGHRGDGFSFDNELPRHRQHVEPFRIASRPVTNGEYRAFVADGGYRRPDLWLSAGWDMAQQQGWQSPLYWREHNGQWQEFTLHGLQPLDDARPVTHVSQFEADAYARWADARLPTEFEWETAAAPLPVEGNFDPRRLHPGGPLQAGAAEACPRRLLCAGWGGTCSSYSPSPGCRALCGAAGG